MENVASTPHRIRFRSFVLDRHTRELYKNGGRLRVQGQPIDVLEMLLESPGELVTREALRKKLWPEDTFVDFEHSLNSTIARLREALGDRAENPQYIETLPKLGYRFVAPVEPGGTVNSISEAAGSDPGTSPVRLTVVQTCNLMPATERSVRNRWFRLILFSAIPVITISAGFWWYTRRPLPPLQIRETEPITQDVRWSYKAPVGTDGTRVYLRTEPPGLRVVPISGGEITSLNLLLPWSSPESAYVTDTSPDGSKLLVRGFSAVKPAILPMWIMSTSGIPVRYLAPAFDGTWSADGTKVIYSTDEGRVYKTASDGGEPHLLFTSKIGVPWRFSWSPDGKRIRFSIGFRSIWEVSSDGSNLHEFLPGMHGSQAKCCGRWTPDGDFYIFTSSKMPFINPLRGGQLWVVDERQGGLRHASPRPVQLTSDPVQWIYPIVSHDSRTIYATGIVNNGELVRFHHRLGRFERYLGGLSAMSLEFSRDGKYFTYVSFPGRKIWRANRDGTGKVLLVEPDGEPVGNLHWSPDGSKILYSAGFQFYLIPAQGGVPVRLPIENTDYESSATWAPDSRRIVYRVIHPLQAAADGIRILDLLTGESTPIPAASKPMFAPNWSPDGRYIFARCGGPGPMSAMFDLHSGRWIYFAKSPAIDVAVWSRDSHSVYMTSDDVTDKRIYRMSIPLGEVERITDLKELKTTGTWGGWFGLDPDDAPMLLHDVGSVEVYALRLERN